VSVVDAGLIVVVLILSILVVGLLRSHAAILRRLHELGAGLESDPGTAVAGTTLPLVDTAPRAPREGVRDGRRAVDVAGTTPLGEAVAIRVLGAEHDTLLVFLSSGCGTCAAFWDDLRDPRLPAGVRLVVVTRGDAEESPSAVAELAPPDATVVMSSEVWDRLEVPGSPFVVHVDGPSGRVVGEGTAASWEQVLDLFLRAAGDEGSRASKAVADRRREQQLDRLLLEAGIAPGDPSLYGTGGSHTVGEPER